MVGSGKRRKATYRDVLAAPEHHVAEIIDGDLYLSPRPGVPHAHAITMLLTLLANPFALGNGGPGGWYFLIEPELHLGKQIVVPDLAAWRRDRMPQTAGNFITIPPAWICEGLSPSTAKLDRFKKLPVYAEAGVEYAWLISAKDWLLEVYGLARGRYQLTQMFGDGDPIRAQPFEEILLELDQIASLPTRASERPVIWGAALAR